MAHLSTLVVSVLGLGAVWAFLYWGLPALILRARLNQERAELKPVRYLDETGTIHRLSRQAGSERR